MKRTFNLNGIEAVAAEFIRLIGDRKAVAFYGEMGAGKTTFIKTVCRQAGVVNSINSPTFSIVNEYETAGGDIIYHIDLYRINNIDDIYNIGLDEIIYSGSLCLIEWPEIIRNLLPPDTVSATIRELTGGLREIVVSDE